MLKEWETEGASRGFAIRSRENRESDGLLISGDSRKLTGVLEELAGSERARDPSIDGQSRREKDRRRQTRTCRDFSRRGELPGRRDETTRRR